MKKITVIAMSLLSVMVTAQKKTKVTQKPSKIPIKVVKKKAPQKKAPMHFGVKAGGNFTKITGDDRYRDLSYKLGFYGGAFVNYDFKNDMSIQMELLYQAAGTQIKYKENNKVKGVWNLNYITVPLQFQYRIIPQMYLETGPEFEYVLKTNQVITDRAGTNVRPVRDFSEETYKFLFAWDMGIGYFITPNLATSFRYTFGISKPYKEVEGFSTDGFRNSNIQLGMAYIF